MNKHKKFTDVVMIQLKNNGDKGFALKQSFYHLSYNT